MKSQKLISAKHFMATLCVAMLVNVFCGDWSVANDRNTQLYLVGVGPGDPDLITLRAIKTIESAQVVFCTDGIQQKYPDYLSEKEVILGYWRLFPYYGIDLDKVPADEQKEAQAISAKRDEFIKLVRKAVSDGKTVAILDNGDPLIFGPWAWCLEEFEDLKPVVIPGVSAFNAANAALSRGITNADRTKSVILTAADWEGKTDTIENLSVHRTSMVLFTMRTEFEEFIKRLSINYPSETPIAIVKFAGFEEQQEVLRATLGTVLELVGQKDLPFEYMIYVGEFLNHQFRKDTNH